MGPEQMSQLKTIAVENAPKAIGPYAAKRQVKIIKKQLSGK